MTTKTKCGVCSEIGSETNQCIGCKDTVCVGNCGCFGKCECCGVKLCMDCLVNFRCAPCIESAESNSLYWSIEVMLDKMTLRDINTMAVQSEMNAKAGDYPDV